ncbi:MAG: NADH-quinone oxidoreductase subunit NuoK [Planctomycetes bacterium]|jgi:NADH-quinone oxidoreductase subunit K|nr:NADH-quinone oxidoreductase subunit NuoK [Planctomycetota bacterium]MCL4730604.1 NADH-quinone oxidoreductase subunit NuoK [Planctomycetota bacterium]
MLEPKTVLFLAALLFSAGLYGVLSRRNMILMLMCLELMLNAVNIALVTYSRHWAGRGADVFSSHSGQFFTLMVMAVAAAEVGIGLAIIVAIFRRKHTADADSAAELRN